MVSVESWHCVIYLNKELSYTWHQENGETYVDVSLTGLSLELLWSQFNHFEEEDELEIISSTYFQSPAKNYQYTHYSLFNLYHPCNNIFSYQFRVAFMLG